MKTNNNCIVRHSSPREKFTPSDNRHLTGFTFVEIIIAVAVLSSGLLYINEAYLRIIEGLNHVKLRNFAESFIENKLWEVEDILLNQDTQPQSGSDGEVEYNNKDYAWNQEIAQLDEQGYLFRADLSMSWREGIREITLSRSKYIAK